MAVALAPSAPSLAKQVLAAVKRTRGRGGTETAILVAGGAGASSRPEQADALRSAHFVVATPGRLADLAASNLAPRLNDASILILDEADRMLQLGFEEQLDPMRGDRCLGKGRRCCLRRRSRASCGTRRRAGCDR